MLSRTVLALGAACAGAAWGQAAAPGSGRAAAIEANTAAQESLRQSDLAGTIAGATRAIGLDPSYQAAYLTRAVAESRQLDDAAALADATQALTVARTAAERDTAYTVRSQYEDNLGDLGAAIADERKRLDIARMQDSIHVRLAELERLNGDLSHAFEDANAAANLNPTNLSAFRERALIERMRHNEDAAHADFLKVQQLETAALRQSAGRGAPPGQPAAPPPPPPPPADAPAREAAIAWRNIGMARARLNDPLGAVDAYTQAIKADPGDFDAWVGRASMAERMYAYDAGIADLGRALEMAATAAQRDQAYSQRATLEADSANYAAALADLRQTLDTSARTENVHYRIALAARDTGDLALAKQELDAAIEVNPQVASYYHVRAAVLRRLGNSAEADADAGRAREAAATAAAGRGAGGRRGAPAGAAAAPGAATASTAPGPSAADAELNTRHTAMETAFRSGDYTSALELAQRILADQPGDLTAHNFAANSYMKMKNYSAAAEQFHQALALQPGEYHNLAGLLEADFRGGLNDAGRQPALDQLRQMSKDQTLPYGVSYYADSFAVGARKVLMQECNNLCGQFQFRYRFEVLEPNGDQSLVLQTESNDFDQASWGKAHLDLLRAGQREFTLDGYRQYVRGERLPPAGTLSATQQGNMLHITYAFFDKGEPTVEQLREAVTKIVKAMPAPPPAPGLSGGLRR